MRDDEKKHFARRLRKTMTRQERLLWSQLRRDTLGWSFNRQKPIGPYVADFACLQAKLVIEVDGATHSTPQEIAYDLRRTTFLNAEGWRVERFHNREVTENLAGVLETISRAAWEHQQALSRTL